MNGNNFFPLLENWEQWKATQKYWKMKWNSANITKQKECVCDVCLFIQDNRVELEMKKIFRTHVFIDRLWSSEQFHTFEFAIVIFIVFF